MVNQTNLILGRTHQLFKKEEGEMTSYAQSIVQFYCELCGISESSLKAVPSPALPESNMSDEEADQQGWLHKDAAKALMRLLWLSRLSPRYIFHCVPISCQRIQVEPLGRLPAS